MANGNFPYNSDQFYPFTNSPAFYSSGPSYSQNQQLFYPSQNDSQQFSNQVLHASQNDLQQFGVESEPSTSSTSKARLKGTLASDGTLTTRKCLCRKQRKEDVSEA